LEGSTRWSRYKEQWTILTHYQRFEAAVAFVLTLVIALIVVVALYRLCVEVATSLLVEAVNPLEHSVFQAVFGQIMTLLIALEFNHTVRYVVARNQSVIQTKVVILIAELALARKFIVLDIRETTPAYLLALAAVALALGLCYWLMSDRDDPSPGSSVSG
jgi:uncharacterized membrane protein (DUF373 family)